MTEVDQIADLVIDKLFKNELEVMNETIDFKAHFPVGNGTCKIGRSYPKPKKCVPGVLCDPEAESFVESCHKCGRIG